jgi:8-oxo-dGTP pyrophosphatase MutT (NUDIX family)
VASDSFGPGQVFTAMVRLRNLPGQPGFVIINCIKMLDRIRETLACRKRKEIFAPDRKESAILVPIYIKDGELHILFTKRSFDVAHHKGQISFPGGARSEEDNSPADTALRESWEEIGLDPEKVDMVGELDDVLTATSNYLIHPYVGMIPYPYDFTINPNEILELIHVPLRRLLDPRNCREENYEDSWGTGTAYLYKYKGKVIWGATAMILKQLLDDIKSQCRNS